MAGSLNRVMLIGRLTRDPELRYTPSGTAVCNLALATNRYGSDPTTGERKEFTDYHDVVVWNQGNTQARGDHRAVPAEGPPRLRRGALADSLVGRRAERPEAIQDRGQRQRRAVPRQRRPSGRCAIRRFGGKRLLCQCRFLPAVTSTPMTFRF